MASRSFKFSIAHFSEQSMARSLVAKWRWIVCKEARHVSVCPRAAHFFRLGGLSDHPAPGLVFCGGRILLSRMPFRRAFNLDEDWGARCKASVNFDRYLITHYFRPQGCFSSAVVNPHACTQEPWVGVRSTDALGVLPLRSDHLAWHILAPRRCSPAQVS